MIVHLTILKFAHRQLASSRLPKHHSHSKHLVSRGARIREMDHLSSSASMYPYLDRMVGLAAVAGACATFLSWAERRPGVVLWRLRRALQTTPFLKTPSANFSALGALRERGELPFHRPDVQSDLLHAMKMCHRDMDSLIVGGAGGIGKRFARSHILWHRNVCSVVFVFWFAHSFLPFCLFVCLMVCFFPPNKIDPCRFFLPTHYVDFIIL